MRRSNLARAPLAAALALGLAALAQPHSALAYCRTSVCTLKDGSKVTGATCSPPQVTDCGIALVWPTLCVSYSLQKDASVKVDLETVRALFKEAFATWTNAACPGSGTPSIKVDELEDVACSLHEYNQKKKNANAIIFRDDEWPYEGETSTLALTTVTYNLDNGQIYDADMELNSAKVDFTTTDKKVEFDLLSVITHETGHFLGMSHSADHGATMFPSYMPGDLGLRTLSDDDIAGICDVYPPGDPIPDTCDPTPRHGFSTLCADDQPQAEPEEPAAGGCCAVAPGAASPGGGPAGLFAALGAMLLAARRRARAAR